VSPRGGDREVDRRVNRGEPKLDHRFAELLDAACAPILPNRLFECPRTRQISALRGPASAAPAFATIFISRRGPKAVTRRARH
jgi:hypothetical protein